MKLYLLSVKIDYYNCRNCRQSECGQTRNAKAKQQT